MKILAIGNSFSQDATTYLHQAALAQGIDLEVYNLYIGGCPLEKHCLNLETNTPDYEAQLNGVPTGRMVSIMEALHYCQWDAIITQQASHFSGWIESYEPFMGILADTIRRECPGVRLLLQETWAYEHTSTHTNFLRYRRNQQEMYDRLRLCYYSMAHKYDLEVIPCGDLIQVARALPEFDTKHGGHTLCRDGFHMNLYGRYLLALAWLKKLCHVSVQDNAFVPEPGCGVDEIQPELMQLVREIVEGM